MLRFRKIGPKAQSNNVKASARGTITENNNMVRGGDNYIFLGRRKRIQYWRRRLQCHKHSSLGPIKVTYHIHPLLVREVVVRSTILKRLVSMWKAVRRVLSYIVSGLENLISYANPLQMLIRACWPHFRPYLGWDFADWSHARRPLIASIGEMGRMGDVLLGHSN